MLPSNIPALTLTVLLSVNAASRLPIARSHSTAARRVYSQHCSLLASRILLQCAMHTRVCFDLEHLAFDFSFAPFSFILYFCHLNRCAMSIHSRASSVDGMVFNWKHYFLDVQEVWIVHQKSHDPNLLIFTASFVTRTASQTKNNSKSSTWSVNPTKSPLESARIWRDTTTTATKRNHCLHNLNQNKTSTTLLVNFAQPVLMTWLAMKRHSWERVNWPQTSSPIMIGLDQITCTGSCWTSLGNWLASDAWRMFSTTPSRTVQTNWVSVRRISKMFHQIRWWDENLMLFGRKLGWKTTTKSRPKLCIIKLSPFLLNKHGIESFCASWEFLDIL